MVPASAYAVQRRSGLVSDFVFRLGLDGRFAYDAAYDISRRGFLAGNGTSTLELQGYPLLVDARSSRGQVLAAGSERHR